MKLKKILPVLLLIIMAVITLWIKRCNNSSQLPPVATENRTRTNSTKNLPVQVKLDRSATNLFFTKHAKCRMKCRHITQQEVKDILANGIINYNKSDLKDPRGPSYAVEGMTRDRQKVRIIFAPRQQHLSVVTVIDLEQEFVCNCT